MVTALEPTAVQLTSGNRIPWFLRGFALHPRSLGLFRLSVGTVLVYNLLIRLPEISVWYTDDGVLPSDILVRFQDPLLSLHLISGSYAIQLALFLVAIAAALSFTAGYRTRIAAIVSAVLYTSMIARDPLNWNGGEQVMRVMLFWSCFLPLDSNDERPHLSLASVAFVLQVVTIYAFAAAEKMDPTWLTERSAVYYALHFDSLVAIPGLMVQDVGWFTRLATVGTLMLELAGPALILVPWQTDRFRSLAVILFVGFHVGLGFTMHLGVFPWVCAAMWLAFLPPKWNVPHVGTTGRLCWPGELLIVPIVVLAALSLLAPTTSVSSYDDVPHSQRLLALTPAAQRWAMFAPRPAPVDGWHIMTGVKNGKTVNLWGTTEEPPEIVSETYPSTRWLAYLARLGGARFSHFRPALANYLCRTHALDSVTIAFMHEWTSAPGKPAQPASRQGVWSSACPVPDSVLYEGPPR